jgi:transcriptional regulator with PAS, ATPase and Fis domain
MTYGNNTKQNNGFEIIGNDPKLNRAIEKAIQVAPTDISVLVGRSVRW